MSDNGGQIPLANEMLRKKMHDLLSHDEKVAHCVLGMDYHLGVLDDQDAFDESIGEANIPIGWIGNMLTLASTFLYAKFNKWRMEKGSDPNNEDLPNLLYLNRILTGAQNVTDYFDKTLSSSSVRVLRAMNGLYDTFDMNFFFTKYLIVNSQIELGFNKHKNTGKGLSRLLGFPKKESFALHCDPESESRVDQIKAYNVKGKNLAEAFNYVLRCRNDSNLDMTIGGGYDLREVKHALNDTMEALEFIKSIKIELDGNGNIIFKEDGVKDGIPTYGAVKLFRKEGKEFRTIGNEANFKEDSSIRFYVLEHLEYILDPDAINAAVGLRYQSFDELYSVSVLAAEKEGLEEEGDYDVQVLLSESAADHFKNISGYLPEMHPKSSFFQGMIYNHYRYHNILAPAIVDAIDNDLDAKSRLLITFVKNKEAAFGQVLEPVFKMLEILNGAIHDKWEDKIEELSVFVKDSSKNEYRRPIDWDALVARILMFDGPTKLIRAALLNDDPTLTYDEKYRGHIETICKMIIAGLEMRYIDKIFDVVPVRIDKYRFRQRILKQPHINYFGDEDHTYILFLVLRHECED